MPTQDPLRDKLDQAAERADKASRAFNDVLLFDRNTPVPIEGGTIDSMSKRIYDQVGASVDAIEAGATAAAASATSAQASATAATGANTAAQAAKTGAEAAQATATSQATASAASAATSSSKATEASASATASSASEVAAKASETASTGSATEANASKVSARQYATSAEASATAADASKVAAQSSADNAAQSELNAKGYSDAGLSYRDIAQASAQEATASKTAASASAASAAASAQEATQAQAGIAENAASALASKNAAKVSETNAASSEAVASAAASSATTAKTESAANAASALASKNSANASEQSASASAVSAANDKTDAQQAAMGANTAKVDAESAAESAETSYTGAASSATSAANSATQAGTRATAAEASRVAAGTSATSAEAAKVAAAASATAAASSASAADASKVSAQNSADNASGSAASAAASAASAANYAIDTQFTFETFADMESAQGTILDGAIALVRESGLMYEKSFGAFAQIKSPNTLHALLTYETKAEAVTASLNLPNGQMVDALDVQERYLVQGGVLVFVSSILLQKNLRDFGAVADYYLPNGDINPNPTDNAIAYQAAISYASEHKVLVDGEGKSYLTTTRGDYLRGIKSAYFFTPNNTYTFSYDVVGAISMFDASRNWQSGITNYSSLRLGGAYPKSRGWDRGVVAIGQGALNNATDANSIIAIGPNTISKSGSAAPSYNIAIGDSALANLTSGSGDANGTRNVAIGSLAGHFITSGSQNILIGRDAGHNFKAAVGNCAIGYQAGFAGISPIGWSGGIELKWGGGDVAGVTCVGHLALKKSAGDYNTALGYYAAPNIKSGRNNIFVGAWAAQEIDSSISWNGRNAAFDLSIPITYVSDGIIVTCTASQIPAIGLTAGDTIGLSFASGPLAIEGDKAVISSVNDSTFTFPSPSGFPSGSGAGSITAIEKTTNRTASASASNVVIGRSAMRYRRAASDNVIIGDSAFSYDTGTEAIETQSSGNVIIGIRAARDHLQLTECVAIGQNAMRWMIDGTTNASLISKSVGLGSDSRVSGSNQVQLGSSGTTTYAYGAVQDRSDARDKADVRDTVLGLDFINDIRAVDFKWDMRDDYVQSNDDGTVTILEKDGSKKRERYHHGVIAQELRAVMEKHGVDFGGFQDHAKSGGCDVLSVGYTELIAPLIKAVQELSDRLEQIETKFP